MHESRTFTLAGALVVTLLSGTSEAAKFVTLIGTGSPTDYIASLAPALPIAFNQHLETRPFFTNPIDSLQDIVFGGSDWRIQKATDVTIREAGTLGSWATWSHGYTGPVYYTEGKDEIFFARNGGNPTIRDVIFYVEPNLFGSFEFEIKAEGAGTKFFIEGFEGALGFHLWDDDGDLQSFNVKNQAGPGSDFAIGEFWFSTPVSASAVAASGFVSGPDLRAVVAAVTVPEPASLTLLGLGVGLLAVGWMGLSRSVLIF